MNYEMVIGLEVHVELKTNSKIFSPGPVHFGAPPNTQTNVIDLGYPGVLPVLNKKAVEFAMKAAFALNCEVASVIRFDRKNYFYPDNPKAYQISQFDKPIGENGWIEIEVNGCSKKIGITRLHLEEDAGKLTHTGEGYSLVDYNRQGTPLIEIVSDPDLRSPEEAYAYLEKLKSIIQYTGVSDCKMEEGSLRCDANISLRPIGQKEFGTKTELKNLNSFSFVQKGLEFEAKRQEEELEAGRSILQETRRYDEASKTTVLMRLKEGAEDYRYFPEPDLPEIHIEEEWKNRVRSEIPELPDQRRNRYIKEWGLPGYDARILTMTREMADFFEGVLEAGADAKKASNWLMGPVSEYLNTVQKELGETCLTPEGLAGLLNLIEDGTISSKIAKEVLGELMENGGDPDRIVQAKGLVQISDESELTAIVNETLNENPQSIEAFKTGKGKALGFLVGQIMKKTKGKANPPLVNQILLQEINKR